RARGPGLVDRAVPWLVSGRTAEALQAQAARLAAHVAAHPSLDPAEIAWSLAMTRQAFEHRAVITGASRDELTASLAALAAGEPAAGAITGVAADPGRLVFVFPGQGGQWPGMGRELAQACPVFAAKLAECAQALAPHTGWDLEQVLAQDELPDRADVIQPALWAVMVSLAAVWQAAGVTPAAVVGHSQGEIAAATVAGILSLDDAAKVVARRSQALTALSGHGGMISVADDAGPVRDRIALWAGRLSVAAVNGPGATVVSGDPQALEELAAACETAGIRTRTLPVDYASHSPQIEQLQHQILTALDGITPGPPRIPMISAMTGQWLDGPEAGPQYWYDSLRAPVEFSRAVEVLAQAGYGAFVETSPHPVLSPAIAAPLVTGTLRRDDGGPARFLASLGAVHVHGIAVDWAAILPVRPRVDLPTYAFRRQRYWPQPAPVPAPAAAEARLWAAVDGGDVRELAAALETDEREQLNQILPLLASWRRREREKSATADWWYRVPWVPVPEPDRAPLPGRWLVVTPPDRAGELPGALTAHGAQVVVVETAAQASREKLAARIGEVVAGAG
ncbi:MAG TPA: acyltransferase domain-containing protein, partial [Streptosporangiaceae bacterium]